MTRIASCKSRTQVKFQFNGETLTAFNGDSVAAALLASNAGPFRTTPVSHAPRNPYCMMGICFDCLVTIDGVGNRQACLCEVTDGMQVETQLGRRDIAK
ncbi:(2Fe-2S)-binding protein [uncultured Paracoccus sp.]|uniref:(2Fe-2S)-binding protein n=1 Tax=Escherichia coli TaxID=562 RepID=UPI00262CE07E|nr:(2Fe-2S)-binding protein [uncultured Paracoccus sp.]